MTGSPQVPLRHSIRLRIAAAMAAVTLAVLAGVGILVDHQSGLDGRERLRDQALERLSAAALVYSANGRLTNGASLSTELPPASLVRRLDTTGDRGTMFDGTQMWAVDRLGPDVVISVRLDAAALEDQRQALRRSLFTAGAIAVLAALALGWLAATGLSRRLRRAASIALTSGASRRPELADAVGGHDEVTALSAAVDEMAAALAERVERERQFGADVAHELRTPLTALVSSAELLPDGEVGALVRNQVERLRRLVEDLLELFRADSGQAETQVEIAELGETVRAILARLPQPVVPTVRRSEPVGLNERRLAVVLANLIANARVHGTEPSVLVDRRRVIVRDRGPGYPAQVLSEGPRRFRRHSGAPGSGLGLAIAEAQARLLGARLSLANDDGAVATLEFPQPTGSTDVSR